MFTSTFRRLALLLSVCVATGYAVPVERALIPTVKLDDATFVGVNEITVDKYLGIPFAKPPVGDLRFRLPVENDPYKGTQSAIAYGDSCPQQEIDLPIVTGLAADVIDTAIHGIYDVVFPDSEDCLTLNVVVPHGTPAGAKLPVVVWIFGGGFELGATTTYDGGIIVNSSLDLGQPVVYVSMNYRLNAFGFLAGQEVKDAGVGNLGLQDQRLALRWIQKYITAFGGDPDQVTIWGESAGAISAALHMVANDGDSEGLFRAAFMESGSPIPVGDITHGQPYYDAIVSETGCSGASDTLECLRGVPYATLKAAMNASPGIFSYQSLQLAWLPRTDGVFLTDAPQQLVADGKVANVPIVSGDCDDEGTLFSLASLNITTDDEVKTYIRSNYIPEISDTDMDTLLTLYPADPAAGSPFDTGDLNALSPQYKRLAAMQGDLVFQAPRRFFLQERSGKQPIWSFLSKRGKDIPALGSVHGSDIANVYGVGELREYLIHFANDLNPNGGSAAQWPAYTTASPNMLTLVDDLINPTTVTEDDYRADGIALITKLSRAEPL